MPTFISFPCVLHIELIELITIRVLLCAVYVKEQIQTILDKDHSPSCKSIAVTNPIKLHKMLAFRRNSPMKSCNKFWSSAIQPNYASISLFSLFLETSTF
jgi:hypothetical protein